MAATEPVIQAYGVPDDEPVGRIQQANFADAQFDAAVSDLERVLREERDRLDPRTVLVIERNLKAIDAAIAEVLSKNPKIVADFKGGKQGAIGPLVGQVMKSVKGADPAAVRNLIAEKIGQM